MIEFDSGPMLEVAFVGGEMTGIDSPRSIKMIPGKAGFLGESIGTGETPVTEKVFVNGNFVCRCLLMLA